MIIRFAVDICCRLGLRRRSQVPALLMLALVLCPFGWLARHYPSLGLLLDEMFADERAHLVGHLGLFALLGLTLLLALPGLCEHPWRYLGLLPAGVAQELLQLPAKGRGPAWDDAGDLLTDLVGLALAYLCLWLWRRLRRARAQVEC